MKKRDVLLLVGSPRGKNSASLSLGDYLVQQLKKSGLPATTAFIYPAAQSRQRSMELAARMKRAAIVILSFPLYVDQLPSPVIGLLERVTATRRSGRPAPPRRSGPGLNGEQRLLAIVQCGFPETGQNRPAGEIVRRFALEAGFAWAGCLAMGMGGASNGRPVGELAGMLRHQIKALNMTAAALTENRSIPAEAFELMARPVIHHRLYFMMANLGWRLQARKNRASARLRDKPYATAGH